MRCGCSPTRSHAQQDLDVRAHVAAGAGHPFPFNQFFVFTFLAVCFASTIVIAVRLPDTVDVQFEEREGEGGMGSSDPLLPVTASVSAVPSRQEVVAA